MMKKNLMRLVVVTAVGAMACSSDSDMMTVPSQQLDVSAALSSTTAGDPWAYPTLSPTAVGLPNPASLIPSNCAYAASTQRFDCAPVTYGGLTIKTSYYLLDPSGASLALNDATKIASLRALVDVTGTLALPAGSGVGAVTDASLTVSKHDDLTLSGLLSTTRTVNGSSTEHDVLAAKISGVNSSTALDITSATANLVLPSGTNKYPASGTITVDANAAMTISPLPAVTTTTHSVLTFNGTSTVTLVSTISGHAQTCRIDLSTFNSACS